MKKSRPEAAVRQPGYQDEKLDQPQVLGEFRF
jgi:hypothetical protein